jgi:pyruvate-ferredoxin/flavodoxin oxidoreductase
MQVAFFRLSNIMETEKAITALKRGVEKLYGNQGKEVVAANMAAIDQAIAGLIPIAIPSDWAKCDPTVPSRFANIKAADIVKKTMVPLLELNASKLKASDFYELRAFLPREAMGTSKFEKRGIAINVPLWDQEKCVQCNSCAFGCGHAAIRPYLSKEIEGLPSKAIPGYKYKIAVSPYDCMGCQVCVKRCPTQALTFTKSSPELFQKMDKTYQKMNALKSIEQLIDEGEIKPIPKFNMTGSQYYTPLLEFSGACTGCHETLYAKLLTQLYGSRLMIANATGCSIVWSASLPSSPWTSNYKNRGPTWSNSLFEDNAEFGLGQYWAITHRREELRLAVAAIADKLPPVFKQWLEAFDDGEKCQPIAEKIMDLLDSKTARDDPLLKQIIPRSDLFIKPSFWIVGGDGWATDIGYSGIDHVIATNADVNILVYDNESYANTGFQMSKATPRGAVMKFAATGKERPKKDLPFFFMNYPDAYVASIAIGHDAKQTVQVIKEAEQHKGASFINTYCPCLGHGLRPSLADGHEQTTRAVESGYWPLFRRDPNAAKKFVLDSKPPKYEKLKEFVNKEVRYDSLKRIDEKRMIELQAALTTDVEYRWNKLQEMANNAK